MNQASPVKKAAPTEEIRPASTEVSPSKIEPNNNNIGETKSTTQSHGGVRATDQLLYLAQLLKFEVHLHATGFFFVQFELFLSSFFFGKFL